MYTSVSTSTETYGGAHDITGERYIVILCIRTNNYKGVMRWIGGFT